MTRQRSCFYKQGAPNDENFCPYTRRFLAAILGGLQGETTQYASKKAVRTVYNAYENGFWSKGKEARFMAPAKERPATKTIATNREARHEYFVLEALETGVELKGTEVKSLRAGGVHLKDSWVDIEDGELLVKGMHITPYDHGNIFNQDPLRVRRLLAHKTEIRRLHQQCKLQGYTLVPLSLYFKHGRVKMEVGLCKGKKLYDKRADAAKRDAKRSIDRAVKSNGKFC